MSNPFNLEVKDKDATHVVIELFGGDNNLSDYVVRDLEEMERGRGDLITVIALVDRAATGDSNVVEIPRGGEVTTIKAAGEIDTGNPFILSDFVASALASYPKAQHWVLGFWDHGTGVFKDQDTAGGPKGFSGGYGGTKNPKGAANCLFFRDPASLPKRQQAMLHDDTDGGVLSNKEASFLMERALRVAGMPGKKFNMIFSDTCLNGMVEVLTQFAPYADVITGSEELEPGDGWNYEAWFKKLVQQPPGKGADWGKAAVDAYGEHYKTLVREHPVTLGAFRTDIDFTQPFKRLIEALKPLGSAGFDYINAARLISQSFAKRDTYDLRDFAQHVANMAGDKSDVVSACKALIDGFDAARIGYVGWGKRVQQAHGLAIWIPSNKVAFEDVAPTYKELEFGKKTGWTDYLGQFYS